MRIMDLTPGCSGSTYEKTPRANFAIVHFLNLHGHEAEHFDPIHDYLHPFRLVKRIQTFHPDVVMVRHFGALLVGAMKRVGFLSCAVVHAWDDYYAEQSRLPRWLVWPMEKWGVRLADYVISVSQYNIHLATGWGVPCEFIPHGTTEPTHATSLRLESGRTKVVYLGDQGPYKGTGRLMEAVRGQDCDLFMVGRANPALQAAAPDNVRFVGSVPAEEVQAVLAQADILVNPSDQDSNFKFFEYIRARKPILGIIGKAEWAFRNGEDALLVSDLRDGLRRLIGDRALREGLAAKLACRETLTWEQMVRRIEAVFLKLVRR